MTLFFVATQTICVYVNSKLLARNISTTILEAFLVFFVSILSGFVFFYVNVYSSIVMFVSLLLINYYPLC